MLTRLTRINFKYLVELVLWRSGSKPTVHQSLNISSGENAKNGGDVSLQAPTPPTAIPLGQILRKLPSLFPRTFTKSYEDYKMFWQDSEKFQRDLLETLPMFSSSGASDKIGRILKVDVDNEGNYINEVCISPKNPAKNLKHVVFVHGYGAGLGFFLKNLEHLSLPNNEWCIHAIDMPGFGYSSRPRFPFNYPQATQDEVHNWFHTRLRTWFSKRGLLDRPQENLVVAHSLGAYVMALYANKHPTDFKKLVMCSPAGVCHSGNIDKGNLNPKIQKHASMSPPWWYVKLWDRNISPFTIVRSAGPLGSKITSGWSYRRFKKLLHSGKHGRILDATQFETLHRYSYGIFNRPGSGEYLLAFALSCGGNPRNALEETIFREPSKTDHFKARCDWVWMYGENDWMNRNGGKRISDNLNKAFGVGKSSFSIVPGAGHHLYFDNYTFFNKKILEEMEQLNRN